MDSSKLPQGQGSDECSSNESGWTAYIASPDQEEEEEDHDDDDDDHDHDQDRGKDEEQREEEDAGSDDSMASDASSGPSNQFGHFNKQFGYKQAKNTNETIHGGKKEPKHGDKKQHDDEKMKAAKDKADSATRSRKK